MDPSDLMQLAIAKAREGIAAGQSPFGCAVAREGRLLSCTHNTVLQTPDITAHAEINALREACRQLGDIFIAGGTAVSTCEPCPMCMAALHWSRVETVYFGATIEDAQRAGFNELPLPAADLVRRGGNKVRLVPGLLQEQCRALFDEWLAQPQHQAY